MKKIILLVLLFKSFILFGQYSSSAFTISKTLSPNMKFRLVSYSFDDEVPTERGFSKIYDISGFQNNFLYEIPRSFDLDENNAYQLFISNDGKKVIYFSETNYYDDILEDKKVMVYENGKLVKNYGVDDFTKCNSQQEKCHLFYRNYNEIVDRKKTNQNLKILKSNVSEKEIFLLDNFIFNKNDSIYVIDNRKKVTIYDLNNLKIISNNINFDDIYDEIKVFRKNKNTLLTSVDSPHKYVNDFQNSANDEKLSETISRMSNLKFVSIDEKDFYKYKLYTIELAGYLNINGNFEVVNSKFDKIFNENKIFNYIKNTKFKSDFVPNETGKFYFKYFFGGFRNFDDKIAEEETIKEKELKKIEFEKRLTQKEINGKYIPKDMKECMTELDKTLNFENKNLLKNAKDTFDFNSHMGGLGMWIRNNWGINGGSRLLKYFHERNIGLKVWGKDTISEIIISNYINWLNGNKNIWREWEEKNPKKN